LSALSGQVFDLDGQGVAAHASRFEEDGFLCLDDVGDELQQATGGAIEAACACCRLRLKLTVRFCRRLPLRQPQPICEPFMCAQRHGLQRLQYAPAASNALTRKVDERDRSKPILAFFASKYIAPGEEITSPSLGQLEQR